MNFRRTQTFRSYTILKSLNHIWRAIGHQGSGARVTIRFALQSITLAAVGKYADKTQDREARWEALAMIRVRSDALGLRQGQEDEGEWVNLTMTQRMELMGAEKEGD